MTTSLTSSASSGTTKMDAPPTPGILRKHNQKSSTTNRKLKFLDPEKKEEKRKSASQRLEMIASQMQQKHEQMYQQHMEMHVSQSAHSLLPNVLDGGGIGPDRGAHWPPSRKREEISALRNLRKALANRVLRTGDDDDQEKAKEKQMKELADGVSNMQLDNRPQMLIQKILINSPMALVSEGHEADTDWHDSEFISECLCWHNVYRQRHGVQELSMSAELCDLAQSWANHLAHTNSFSYRAGPAPGPGGNDVGQNLFCRLTGSLQADVTGQEVAAHWYSACKQYNYFKEPDVLHANVNAGHFTQLIWASTRELGVGKARSRQGKVVVVANYRPAGNVSGLFEHNVPPPVPDLDLPTSLSGSESSASCSA